MARPLAELRKMQKSQLKSINKDELIESILTTNEPDGGVVALLDSKLTAISAEIGELRKTILSPDGAVVRRINDMQARLDKQADTILHQQLFLEALDRKDRETHVVVLGVPDDGETLDGVSNDEEKLKKIWTTINEETAIRSHRRLGRRDQGSTRNRPVLVVMDSKSCRDGVLEKAKRLKESGSIFSKVYIKKDVHPSVRNEWTRLRKAETAEKERPENAGCSIHFDARERKLYRDGVVIDSWNPHPF